MDAHFGPGVWIGSIIYVHGRIYVCALCILHIFIAVFLSNVPEPAHVCMWSNLPREKREVWPHLVAGSQVVLRNWNLPRLCLFLGPTHPPDISVDSKSEIHPPCLFLGPTHPPDISVDSKSEIHPPCLFSGSVPFTTELIHKGSLPTEFIPETDQAQMSGNRWYGHIIGLVPVCHCDWQH